MSSFLKHPGRRRKIIVLVDGNALIHRGYYALPETMRTRDGRQVNAVFGFASVLLNMLALVEPQYVVCSFDLPGKTFRHKQFEEYKAQRTKAPDELYEQIPLVKELVRAMNIPILEEEGYEADDVIGSLSVQLSDVKGLGVLILTGDKDLYQLVNDDVHVLTLKKGVKETIEIDAQTVVDSFGFTPSQMTDYKGLRGDPSDNIPGVRGVGDKTAVTLLSAFGSIEKMYEHSQDELEGVVSKRIAGLLLEKRGDAEMSKELATIVTDLDLEFSLDDAIVHDYDHGAVVELFQDLEFKSLLKRLPHVRMGQSSGSTKSRAPGARVAGDQESLFEFGEKKKESEKLQAERGAKVSSGDYVLVQTKEQLRSVVDALRGAGGFVFDTETTSLNARTATLLGIGLAVEEGKAWYVDVVAFPGALAILKPIFEDASIAKWGHHLKYDYHVLFHAGIVTEGMTFDTMVASYVLDSSRRNHSLDHLAFLEFGYTMQSIEELIGPKGKNQKSMADVPVDDVVFYACEDVDMTLRLKNVYEQQLERAGLMNVLTDIDVPLIPVLAAMEHAGVVLDVDYLKTMEVLVEKRLEELRQSIWKDAGTEFNVNSTKQLREVLFETLRINTEGIKKGKTGYSTAVSELEKLRGRHPIIEKLFEYRELEKLRNTYIVPLPQMVEDDGRVHTSYNQTVAATGRLSSDKPNLQNIPVRTEMGREIRKAFVAKRGYRLVAIDYSQIELRIAASLSRDPNLVAIFEAGGDIHTETAAKVYGIPPKDVSKEQRYSAKALNFGVLYGMGPFGFARDSGVTVAEAKEFIEAYMAEFTGLAAWIESAKEAARKKGYAATMLGRRRPLLDITASNFQVRAAAERMAVNMPIQGLNADMMKLAMIEILPMLTKKFPDSAMILQVHDELVFEVPTADVSTLVAAVAKIMEGVVELEVPVVVEAKVGKRWGDMKPV